MRGYIYEDVPIDLNFIKELHRNTTEYFKQINFSFEDFQQALVLYGKNTDNFILPEKPIIYYQAMINDQNLPEVLHPYLYIPIEIINAVRAQRGGLSQTNILLILSGKLTPKQAIESTKERFALSEDLISFFERNPCVTKYLEETALAAQAMALTVKPEADIITALPVSFGLDADNSSELDLKTHVDMGGTIRAKKLGVLVDGAVKISAELESEDLLLASFFEDVILESIVERVGSLENFNDVIKVQARAAAKNILQIYAGRNVVFKGAQTGSGVLTQVQALANILDIPVELVHQRVEHFHSKRQSITTKDVYIKQHRTEHKTGGDLIMEAVGGSTMLVAPKVTAKTLQIVSAKESAVLDAKELHLSEVHITEKKRNFIGASKTVSMQASVCSQRSIGAELDVETLEISAGDGVKLVNVDSKARINRLSAPSGKVEILAGRNNFESFISCQSSDLFWHESTCSHPKAVTFSECKFRGPIEIDAKNVTLEMVKNSTANLLQQIVLKQGKINCSILEAQYSIESCSTEGPGVGLIGLVALATSIATYGACSGFAASLLSMPTAAGATVSTGLGMAHAGLAAGFSGLCGKAAGAILINDGDPFKAIKSISNLDTVKSFATDMASAGLLHGAAKALKIPALAKRDMLEHARYNIARAAVSTTLKMSINNQESNNILLDGLVDAAVGTVLANLTSKIDGFHDVEKVGDVNHKIFHAALGAAKNVAENTLKGKDFDLADSIITGAMEGAVSSTFHQVFDEKVDKAVSPRLMDPPEAETSSKGKETVKNNVLEKQDQDKLDRKIAEREARSMYWLRRSGIFSDLLTLPNPKSKDRQIIDQYDLQQSNGQYHADYLEDDNQSFHENLDNFVQFGHGLLKGVVVNTGIGVACSLPMAGPIISAGLLFAGATSAYAWASSKLSKFEQDNFILSEDYENIMRNPLISDQQKQHISRDAHARYEQAQQDQENASLRFTGVVDAVKEMCDHDPERLGSSVGLFFGFRKPIAGVATINSNPIRPGLPVKINTVKSKVSSSKPRVTNQQQATSSSHNASSVNAQANLSNKLSALETAQKNAVKTEMLPGGRIRYYTKERPATKIGPTRSSSYVTEYNPDTGQVRSWIENYSHDGNINRVHPKMLDGQVLEAQHYPPTQAELNSFTQKPGGPK
jgi:hypothetical protein